MYFTFIHFPFILFSSWNETTFRNVLKEHLICPKDVASEKLICCVIFDKYYCAKVQSFFPQNFFAFAFCFAILTRQAGITFISSSQAIDLTFFLLFIRRRSRRLKVVPTQVCQPKLTTFTTASCSFRISSNRDRLFRVQTRITLILC